MIYYLLTLFGILCLSCIVAYTMVPKKYVNADLLIAALDNPRIMKKIIG